MNPAWEHSWSKPRPPGNDNERGDYIGEQFFQFKSIHVPVSVEVLPGTHCPEAKQAKSYAICTNRSFRLTGHFYQVSDVLTYAD